MYTPFTIERGNLWLSKQFKISDVISYRPISPSQLNQADGLVEGLREEGIRYGALLAGGQKLASDKNLSDTGWVTSIVEQQRELQGQLYINHQDKFSMCKLYDAAETVLNDNLKRQTGLSADVSASETNALAELKDERVDACSANLGDKTNIKVKVDEIKGWADSFKQAKEFVGDLNSRFLNMRCDDPAKEGEGFFDCDYVNVTQDYYNNLELFYKSNKVELTQALHGIRADIEDFIICLKNSSCDTEYTKDALTYTLVPVESTKEKVDGVDKYYAFDFRITGTRSISSTLSLTFNEIPVDKQTDKITESDYNYIRVVYQGDKSPLETPAKLAFGDENNNAPLPEEGVEQGVEPLGFDINIPSVTIKNTDESSEFKDFNLYFFSAKLLGVKPISDEHKDKAMHYNLTEVSAGLNVQGGILGNIMEEGEEVELANTAELTFKAKFSDAANYYAPSIWPDANDYFVTDSGVVAPKEKPGLFEYNLVHNKNILISSTQAKDGEVTETWGNADYLELTVAGTTNRYEVFEQEGKYALRSCFIDSNVEEIKKEASKICRASEQVAEDFNLIDDLIYSEEKYFSNFAIPAYGSYKPDIPEGVTWGEGTWNGILVAEFAQGVDNFELRIGQEFVDDSGDNIKRRPSAILKVKANKKTDTNWELAASMGYKYKYLVDVLPMGEKDTQSFYFAYSVKEFTDADGSKAFVEELGSLSIIRAGTKLFQLEEGKTVNGTLASRVDYEIDKDVVNNCGYSGHQMKTKSCNAIAYLTVRGKLLGVLREENGAYVMRYSDGTWSLIGGN